MKLPSLAPLHGLPVAVMIVTMASRSAVETVVGGLLLPLVSVLPLCRNRGGGGAGLASFPVVYEISNGAPPWAPDSGDDGDYGLPQRG